MKEVFGASYVEEINSNEMRRKMELLERGALELKHASRQALGFVNTIEYDGISYNVSRRFVIADLSPLAFFHLIEPISQDSDSFRASSIESAVHTLHERLLPLLTCTHQWTPLKRNEDERVLSIMTTGTTPGTGSRPRICKACTAYALEQSLPVVGRSLA